MQQASRVAHSKPVLMFDKNGVLICEFPSATYAANIINAKQQNISACCYGKIPTVNGFLFKFK